VANSDLIGIVVVANGRLARELRTCLEQIIGQLILFETVEVEPGHNRESKQQEICEAASRVDQGRGVVVVTDLFGSSPANLAFIACHGMNIVVLCGVNLPMLVKLAKSRRLELNQAAQSAFEAGRQHIRIFDDV